MDTKVIKQTAALLFITMQASMAQVGSVTDMADKNADFMAIDSRKLDGEAKSEWILSMRAKLPITRREIGPFGLAQNRDVKIVRKVTVKPKSDAFAKAIKSIKVNAVLAKEGKFIIGAREFTKGDVFPMVQGPNKFKIKILNVRSNYITFENLNTAEVVKKNLDALPSGVSRNTGIEALPGIQPTGEIDKTLHLDSPSNSSKNK